MSSSISYGFRLAWTAALVVVALGSASGCSSATAETRDVVCGGFEESWNSLMETRSETPRDLDIAAEVDSTVAEWTRLGKKQRPYEITDVVANAAGHLVSLRGARDPQMTKRFATSLGNAARFIELECDKGGSPIVLAPMLSLVAPAEAE